jgi:serine/threonine protein kinase
MWTLGCLLAEIALNEPLFECDTEIELLFRVFAFLGVPESLNAVKGSEIAPQFPQWTPIQISHAGYSKRSKEFIKLCKTLVPSREDVFNRLIRLNAILGSEGMNLLELLLQINPQKRPTAEYILTHPFFRTSISDVMKVKDEVNYSITSLPSETLKSIWTSYLQNEQRLRPKSDYMKKQTSINEIMRAILIDWLIDVSVHFDLSQETLHYAVMYLDRALSDIVIDKSRLQLLGVTCMKIADVFNENSKEYYRQENAKEYVFITAGEYTEDELLTLEKEILTLMKFQLYSPTVIHFLKLYGNLIQLDERTKILSNVNFTFNILSTFLILYYSIMKLLTILLVFLPLLYCALLAIYKTQHLLYQFFMIYRKKY